MKRLPIALAAMWLGVASTLFAADEFHIDFGPPDSPIMEGFTGADAATVFAKDRGFGWIGAAPENYTAPKPEVNRSKWYQFDPNFFYDDIVTDLRRDGVESEGPFSFKVDVPKGRYRVTVTVGHLNEPRYSIDIYCNGELMRKKIDARHWLSSERGRLHKACGYYNRARFSVEAGDEGLLFEFKGDDEEFKKLMAQEIARDPDTWPVSRFRGDPLRDELYDYRPYYDVGGPFTKISLMGLEVYPEQSLPVQHAPETLALSAGSGVSDEELPRAIQAFNGGKFEKAEQIFAGVDDPLAKGLGFLALSGRPDYGDEYELAKQAEAALNEAARAPGASGHVKELHQTAAIYLNGLHKYKVRGIPPNKSLRSTWNAVAELDQTQPDDPHYYRSLEQEARLMIMLDPHQWAWNSQEAKRKFAVLEKKYPQNRFVQFYLHDSLEAWPAWQTPDYLGKARAAGAPEWAAGLYAVYNHLVDFSEWWALNKQASDGSIGGGWGDDVELVGLFGYIARVSDGVSPASIQCARKLMHGLYEHSGDLDSVGGYFPKPGDTEHTAEFTGKTLPMMMDVDYGNPTWRERAMQSAKLMNELWMGVNKRGHFHWRANFLGASGIGSPASQLDSAINWRAANPAVAILRLTNHPGIRDMVMRHAESLYEDAMRTDKGKPAGLIPGDIDYETDEIGGRNVKTWYDPGDIPGRRMYGFESYHAYRGAVMDLAYRLTGDGKFLEPIKSEMEYATAHGGELDPKRQWKTERGSPEWIALSMTASPNIWKDIQMEQRRRAGEDVRILDTKTIQQATFNNAPRIRNFWPYVTTESLATDRIYLPGAEKALLTLVGAQQTDWTGHLTYRHVGRNFAAAVLGAGETSLTAIAYLFDFDGGASKRTLGLTPWKLELGAKYRAAWGPDADGDEKMDREEGSLDFTLAERGQSVDLELSAGRTYIIQISQSEPSKLEPLLADLAIGPDDVEYNEKWELIYITVHNIGAKEASEYDVLVKADTGEQFSAVGNRLNAPLDFTPQRLRFGFPFVPTREKHTFQFEVKSRGGQPELTMLNNKLEAEVEFEQTK